MGISMPVESGTFPVTVGTDHGMAYGTTLSTNDGGGHFLGYAIAANYRSVNRITGLTIPGGSYITQAVLQFKSAESKEATVGVIIRFELAGDSAALSTYAEFNARPLTPTGVQWDLPSTLVTGVWYDSADVSEALREVIALPAWASGNAIMAVAANSGSAVDTYYQFYNYYTGYPVRLYVEWGPMPADDEVASWNPYDAGNNLTFDSTLLTVTHA